MEILGGLLSAFGLSGAAGLNAWLPLLLVGLLERFGVLQLAQPYDLLSNTPALIVVALLGVLDFVGDKVPGLDHALHLLGGVLNALSGALLFASQHGLVGHLPPALALALGFVVAGGVQATRTALRPVATATTGGLVNPLVSAAEDGTSLVLSGLAVFAPLLAVLLLIALLVGGWRLLGRVRGRLQRR